MQRCIAEYEPKVVSLGSLVSTLEALQSTLEGESASFNARFSSLWGRLEDTYAFILDESRSDLNDLDNRTVSVALEELKTLISAELR